MLNPDVPPPLEAICLKAMAKLPDNRYQTAAEFRSDLERFRNGEPVLATPLLDAAATTQALPGRATPEQTAMLGGTAVADRTSRYAGYAEPVEERRMSFGWVVLSILALLLVGAIAYFITRTVTGAGTETTITTQAPPTTQQPTTTPTTQPTTTPTTQPSTTPTTKPPTTPTTKPPTTPTTRPPTTPTTTGSETTVT
jgi:cell division septation protein DedD